MKKATPAQHEVGETFIIRTNFQLAPQENMFTHP